MASFKLAQTLVPKQLKGAIAQRCLTSAASGIIGLRSRCYVLGTSSNNEWRSPGWSQHPRRFIAPKHTVPSQVATGQLAPWIRCYSIQNDPLELVESEEDVQSIIEEVGPLVSAIDALHDEAEKAERTINRPGQGLDFQVAYAYACLRDLTNVVTKVACTETLAKSPRDKESLYYVVKSFKSAIHTNEEAVKKLGNLQEQYTDYAGKMSSLVGRLGAAKQFLVDRIKSENNLLKLAVTQLNQAARDLDEVKQEIFRLRKELELKRKLQPILGGIPFGYVGIAALEMDIRAKSAKRESYEEQLIRLQKTKDTHRNKADEIQRSINNLTLSSGQLSSRQELLQRVATSNRNATDRLLKIKHSLVGTQNNLADINASAQIAFEPSFSPSYCQTILRIVLLMPNVTDSNRQEDELQRIVIANDICMIMEKMPQRLLTEDDPLDYGSEEKSLGVLLKEAQAFLRSRLMVFEQNVSGNAEAVLDRCRYKQENWLALKRSIMGKV